MKTAKPTKQTKQGAKQKIKRINSFQGHRTKREIKQEVKQEIKRANSFSGQGTKQEIKRPRLFKLQQPRTKKEIKQEFKRANSLPEPQGKPFPVQTTVKNIKNKNNTKQDKKQDKKMNTKREGFLEKIKKSNEKQQDCKKLPRVGLDDVEKCFKNVVAKRFLIDLGDYKEEDKVEYDTLYNTFKEEDRKKISDAFEKQKDSKEGNKNQQDLTEKDIDLIIKMYKAVTIDMVRVGNKLCDSPVEQYLTLEYLTKYFNFKPEEIDKLKQLFPDNATDDTLMLKLREFCKNNFLKSLELERELKAKEHCISRKEDKLFDFPPRFKTLVVDGIEVPIECLFKDDKKKPKDEFKEAIKRIMIEAVNKCATHKCDCEVDDFGWDYYQSLSDKITNLCYFHAQWGSVLPLIKKLQQKQTTNQESKNIDRQETLLELYANLRDLSKYASDKFKIEIEDFIKKLDDGSIKESQLSFEINRLIKRDLLENRLSLILCEKWKKNWLSTSERHSGTIVRCFLKDVINVNTGYMQIKLNVTDISDNDNLLRLLRENSIDCDNFSEDKIIDFINAPLQIEKNKKLEKLKEEDKFEKVEKQEQDYKLTLIRVKKNIKERLEGKLGKGNNEEKKDDESVPEIEVLSCGYEKIIVLIELRGKKYVGTIPNKTSLLYQKIKDLIAETEEKLKEYIIYDIKDEKLSELHFSSESIDNDGNLIDYENNFFSSFIRKTFHEAGKIVLRGLSFYFTEQLKVNYNKDDNLDDLIMSHDLKGNCLRILTMPNSQKYLKPSISHDAFKKQFKYIIHRLKDKFDKDIQGDEFVNFIANIGSKNQLEEMINDGKIKGELAKIINNDNGFDEKFLNTLVDICLPLKDIKSQLERLDLLKADKKNLLNNKFNNCKTQVNKDDFKFYNDDYRMISTMLFMLNQPQLKYYNNNIAELSTRTNKNRDSIWVTGEKLEQTAIELAERTNLIRTHEDFNKDILTALEQRPVINGLSDTIIPNIRDAIKEQNDKIEDAIKNVEELLRNDKNLKERIFDDTDEKYTKQIEEVKHNTNYQ